MAPDDFFGSDDQTERLVSDSATGTGVILGTVGYMAPERRFQSAAAPAFSIEGILGSSSTAVSAPALPLPSPRFAWASRRFLSLVTAARLVVALLAGVAAVLVRVESAAAQPTFDRLTFRTGNIPDALFTPDGQTVICAADWEGEPVQLFSTRIETPESRARGPPNASRRDQP